MKNSFKHLKEYSTYTVLYLRDEYCCNYIIYQFTNILNCRHLSSVVVFFVLGQQKSCMFSVTRLTLILPSDPEFFLVFEKNPDFLSHCCPFSDKKSSKKKNRPIVKKFLAMLPETYNFFLALSFTHHKAS